MQIEKMERKLIKDIPMMPSKTKQVKNKPSRSLMTNHIPWLIENQHSFAIETGVNSYPTILLFNSDSEPQVP